ncbi:FAD-dependent oxidoreductase domain-containing protein 2 [Geodia barretti]|uniref:FAD-dependent oxidoreductase domain-containing protein 2 n=1 Tax=Geodia barretti TaxID=519541 RepID=A0AA35XG34_GEOBA|nr:FAD-dependent oxidoreductase domain-containing protein 2 [Geodia barretti]
MPFPLRPVTLSARAMEVRVLLVLSFLSPFIVRETLSRNNVHKYCVIGAGPGGLQIGYFLDRAGRDYIIFEKNTTAGSFFTHYPRHRTLISINKRHTGSKNREFSFRHDWNSLISDDPTLFLKHYTDEYFPVADVYVRYLQDYAEQLQLKIQYETEIKEVDKGPDEEGADSCFHLKDQNGVVYRCDILIVSTGLWVPHVPDIQGIEHAQGYESMSLDRRDYEGKRVLIIGRGNAGFETGNHIVGNAAYIHMTARSRIKLAYQTHYVGDVRAINNQMIDTYQLKSLDGQFELFTGAGTAYIAKDSKGNLFLSPMDKSFLDDVETSIFSFKYDTILRCTGFMFDFSIFNDSVRPRYSDAGQKKFPLIQPTYEVSGVPDMFIGGIATHSLDYKRSAGGFIHGYRYTARALNRHLEWKYEGVPWPSVSMLSTDLPNYMIKRINEASGPYQMFGVLADVALLRDNGTVVYLEEVPVQSLPAIHEMTGHKPGRMVIWDFEYGPDYSGPGEDVLREDRAIGDPFQGDNSNFLHPVLYYYISFPSSFKGLSYTTSRNTEIMCQGSSSIIFTKTL